jgi:hypothetical protein
MPVARDMVLYQNEDFTFAVRWKMDTVIQVLTDAAFTVRKKDTDLVSIIEATTLDGRIVIDTDNWVRITIPIEDLEVLGAQRAAYYDIRVTRDDGLRKLLLNGKITFDLGVTR